VGGKPAENNASSHFSLGVRPEKLRRSPDSLYR